MKKSDSSPQLKRFVETARQLECDEDQERFEKKLGKIATAKTATGGKVASKATRRAR